MSENRSDEDAFHPPGLGGRRRDNVCKLTKKGLSPPRLTSFSTIRMAFHSQVGHGIKDCQHSQGEWPRPPKSREIYIEYRKGRPGRQASRTKPQGYRH